MGQARDRITAIRRAAITKFNADYREKLVSEGHSLVYVNYEMEKIEQGNELSDLFWSHAIIEYLDETNATIS